MRHADNQPVALARDDRLLGPTELSEYLGIPVPTIYAWRYRGEGPRALRVGRHLRYRRSDVDRWLDERADTAAGGR